jgi:TonB family protein
MNARKNFFVVMLFALSLCVSFSTTNAQDHTPRTISGGVLNGRAVSLPKPVYPQIAKAARASGTVVVQVMIDENGDVVSASAVSGHPLLKAAAVQAAQGAKFSPTLLQGVPVKVTGTINYNFVLPMSWVEIGVELSQAEKGANHYLSPSVAFSLYAQQFEMESKELRELEGTPQITGKDVKAGRSTSKQESPQIRKGVTTVVSSSKLETIEPTRNAEYSRRISSVISSLESKLMGDAIKSWYFSLGLMIGRAEENVLNEETIPKVAEQFRNHSFIAPKGVSETIISRIQQIVSFSNKSSFDKNDVSEIHRLFQEILSAPIEKY